MKAARKPLLLSLVIGLLILACGAGGQLGLGADENPADKYGIDREDAIFLVDGQPRTLDPAKTHSSAWSPIGAIFSGLVTLDTDLQVQPDLAAGWEVSQDDTLYTFYLRPEAVFHDGRPVTADDVIFSWERAADPATGSDTALTYLGDIVGVAEMVAGQADHIRGLRAIDDHTLEVRIDAPKVYFLDKLTYPVSFVVDRQTVVRSDWERQPNGTGPFALQEWQDDEVLILERNEEYYRAPASVSHIVYLLGAGIPLSMYENDEIDLVGVGGGTLERVEDPNDPLHSELRLGVDMCTSYISFNTRLAPFDNPLVRQAFSHALDRQKLVDGLFMGNALPAEGPLPPGMPGYQGGLQGQEYDPAKARALLAQAGYPDPSALPAITYTTSGYGSVGAFVTAVITMWQDALGVTIEPVLLEPFTYLDELYAGHIGHIFSQGWCADYPDPENFLDVLFHSSSQQNLGGYSNPAIDALLEQARVEPDVEARMALYGDIERRIVADAPSIFLTHNLSAELVKPYLKDYVHTPIGVAQWHLVRLER